MWLWSMLLKLLSSSSSCYNHHHHYYHHRRRRRSSSSKSSSSSSSFIVATLNKRLVPPLTTVCPPPPSPPSSLPLAPTQSRAAANSTLRPSHGWRRTVLDFALNSTHAAQFNGRAAGHELRQGLGRVKITQTSQVVTPGSGSVAQADMHRYA